MAYSVANPAGPPREVVFIDSRVPDLDDLLDGLAPDEQAFVIDPGSDGPQQIAALLAANDLTSLSSISIVGHGASGEIELGSTTLDDADLASQSAALAQIGAALAPGGDLQLYACDAASGAAGQRFIADLSKYAGGVDVAAATHLVGSADGGGGWTLDAATDPNAAPASAPFTQQAMADFQGELIDAIDVDQPSLGMNQLVVTQGLYPAQGGPGVDPEGIPIGGLEEFAGGFNLDGTELAMGQSLSVSSNAALFSILGPTYGGNGTSNFDLPDLGDKLAVGTGGSSQSLGANFGDDYVTLGNQNMPSQTGGGGQAFDDDQPSQQINYLINVGGSLPSGAGDRVTDVIGEIIPFLGDFAPSGYMLAQGQSLQISQYSSLYDVIGNTYGGVVGSTFDLPNLDGRTIIGAGVAGGVTYTLGEQVGQDHATILPGNLPGGGDSPIVDYQPSLALNYLICTDELFPNLNGAAPTGDAVVGEIVAYAGSTSEIPPGWALCDGQLLSINIANEPLFTVIGTHFGGDGRNTFALPDLEGRSIAGLGTEDDGEPIVVGEQYGAATITLSNADVPAPAIGSTGDTVQFYQGGAAVPLDSQLTLTDTAADINSATVTISSHFVAGDTLTFNGGTNTETFGDGSTVTATQVNGVLTLTTASGAATAADYQTALRSVAYSFSGDPTDSGGSPSRDIGWTVTDANGNGASGGSDVDVYMTPGLAGTVTPTPKVTVSGGEVFADPNLTLTDHNAFGGAPVAKVSIISGAQAGDNLSIPTSDLTGTGIRVSGDGTTTLTLTSDGQTNANEFTYALDDVRFGATGQDGARGLTWSFDDDAGGNPNGSDALTTTVDAAFAPVVTGGLNISGAQGSSTGLVTVATFTDPGITNPTAGDFTATITWGDGSQTGGRIATQTAGVFAVIGNHTYADEGAYPVGVKVTDTTGANGTASDTAMISDAPLTAGTVTVSGGVEGATPATLSATFTYGDPNAPTGDFSGTIDWGDGATTPFSSDSVSGGDGSFTVSGSHIYATAGLDDVSVTIDDVNGGVTTDTGTTTVAPCYCRGTLILTDLGEVAVEKLAIGDLVVTASGASRPVRWLGHRALDCARHADPIEVWPVRVSAGAFGENRPSRDLWLSPGHNIAWEGALIPIRALMNGKSVVQVESPSVEYWHVELDRHDVILAEGLPAESYLDTGNRTAFVNGGAFIEAHPTFAPRHWAQTCLPLVFEGPPVHRAKARLLERLMAQGHATTSEADLHVLADGRRIDPMRLGPMRFAFRVPIGSEDIRLVSRVFVPAHMVPESADPRSLGVCVGGLQIDFDVPSLDDERLSAAGWHDLEPRHRWTRGDTPLPSGTRLVVIDLVGSARYWREDDENKVTRYA